MKTVHNYLLKEKLSENELVQVYRAVEKTSQKSFCLSFINKQFEINPKFLMRIISAKSKLQFIHPHVAKIIDFGEINHQQYYISEYFGNKTLTSFLAKPVPVTFALDVISQLASGLHYLSLQGFVHGNVRPGNVFLDQYGNAIISAIALLPKENIEGERHVSRYQSPESIALANIDESSDLYSLGILLFELLTGERFSDRKYIAASDLKNVNELIPYLPEDNFGFQPVINKLLAKNPKQRYQNGLQLVDALNEYDSKLENIGNEAFSIRFDEEFKVEDRKQQPDSQKVVLGEAKSDKSIFDEKDNNKKHHNKVETAVPAQSDLTNNKNASEVHQTFGLDPVLTQEKTVAGSQRAQGTSIKKRIGVGSVGKSTRKVESAQHSFFPQEEFRLKDYVKRKHLLVAGFSVVFLVPVFYLFSDGGSDNSPESPVLVENERNNTQVVNRLSENSFQDTSQDIFLTSDLPGTQSAKNATSQNNSNAKDMHAGLEAENKRFMRTNLSATSFPPLITKQDVQNATQVATAMAQEIEIYLKQAQEYIKQLKFTTPPGRNAYAMYQAVQALDPDNAKAQEGISTLADGYAYMAKRQIEKDNYNKAKVYVDKGLAIQTDNAWLIGLKTDVNNWFLLNSPLDDEPMEAVAFDGLFE